MLRWAMYYHRVGRANMALSFYSQIARVANERDTRMLAAVHQVILLLNENSVESEKVR